MSSTPLSYTAWHIWQSVWFHSHHWFSPCHSFALSPDSTLNFPYSKLEYRVGILNLKFFLKQQSIDDNCCCFVESRIWVLVTPWTAAHQTSLSFIIFQSLLKLMSIESDDVCDFKKKKSLKTMSIMFLYGSLSYIVDQKVLKYLKWIKTLMIPKCGGALFLTVSFPCFILSKMHRIIIHAP